MLAVRITAFQAEYEGSIPFTRSSNYEQFVRRFVDNVKSSSVSMSAR